MDRLVACGAAVVITACEFFGVGFASADPTTPTPGPSTAPSAAPASAPSTEAVTPHLPPVGPVAAIDRDGTFAVGTELQPGVYSSAGPAEGTKCYWRRIGADNTTLNNALSSQPQVVLIEATDVAFKTRGCQPWQLTEDAVLPGETPPWLSQLKLRHELDILNGLAGQSGNGQLPPY